MNDQDLCGKWVGEYTYGEEYTEPVRGKKVAFEINITLHNGLLKGDCTDEETNPYFNQPALIEGSILGNAISFIKRYPHYWQNEEGGPRFLPKLPSQEVRYSGQFIDGQFEGEWEVATVLTANEGAVVTGTGKWFMRKVV
jgi:hypothetical protein